MIHDSAFAAITNPYTVDEKLQVISGDSIQISATSTSGEVVTYYGMENYAHDYISNYLHITYTYTHKTSGVYCCTATFSPRLYITDADPREIIFPQVKLNAIVYYLVQALYEPEHINGWYLYDIQFDASGYRVSVKRSGDTEIYNAHTDVSGLTNNDWVAFANLHPIGPNEAFSFTPLLVYQAPATPSVATSTDSGQATTTPVIIVPGIMGSYLNKEDDTEVWINLLKMVLPGDEYLDDLKLSETGDSLVSLEATDIVRLINVPLFRRDNFLSLVNTLEDSDYMENEYLFTFPYDWRVDIQNSAQVLRNKINDIKSQLGVEKVNLVAHSMGGLLVKKYLKDYGGDSVDKFVDIGTPHEGSPNSFSSLMYGYTDISILNKERIKSISQNMSSVYELLPSRNYFDDSNRYYVFDAVSGNDRLTFDQTSTYLKTSGRNSALVDRADTFHQEIDGLNPSDYGVETYNIVGCGTPTIGQFYILEAGEHSIYNIKMINGDGTVPLRSAEALTASTTYYVKSAQHAVMPSTSGVKELIASLLSTTTPDISSYSNLSLTSSGCTIPNGKIVSFHSPIELHIYDSSGNHTGPDSNGDIENDIAGVTYEVIDDNKFAFLPNGVEYTIKGNATSAGTFDVRIQELVNGEVATTTVFAYIPLTTTTKTQFAVGSSIPSQIPVDSDNDGTFERDYGVSNMVSGVLESTGKSTNPDATVGIPTSTDVGTSKPVATSSEPFIPIPISTTTPTIVVPLVQIDSRRPTIAPTSTQETKYENSALVYKSLTYKVKSVFTRMWSWVKSKL